MEPADLIAARSKLQALHIWWVLCRFIYTFGLSSRTHSGWSPWLKVILHGTIRNDDFKLKTALQCSNSVATIRNNATTMLQRCVALKIVVANLLVYHHLNTRWQPDKPISVYVVSYSRHHARENVGEKVAVDVGNISDWLRKWHDSFSAKHILGLMKARLSVSHVSMCTLLM